MKFIDIMKEKAKKKKVTIVLPEYMDDRVVEAAKVISSENIANIIILGSSDFINKNKLELSGITLINPENADNFNLFIEQLMEIRKNKNLTFKEAKELLCTDYMYYACMLIINNLADGIVSGACHSTANTLRPALQIIKTKPNSKLVSSFFIMDVPNCNIGENGIVMFGDAALEQNPTPDKLASIALDSAQSFKDLIEKEPKVALLSHSTKGSASHPDVDKVKEATNIINSFNHNFMIDGELQLDAAISPEVANLKAPDSPLKGDANVLIFPDLDSANIGYKLVQRFAKADAFGPICQGIAAPVNDLSRGCSINDVIGTIAITAVLAQKK